MVSDLLTEPGKLEEALKNVLIKAIKENNDNMTPIDITYNSGLSNSEIDSIISKLNSINMENNRLIHNLINHRQS
ncbi:hypothetical protein PQ712_12690, partial [Staphylococcus ureilyticus]|uniref:hypothetical protein n=1 Tax=Staphylococcus ureilyticus TaxID=94138 RepID=UPI00292783E7